MSLDTDDKQEGNASLQAVGSGADFFQKTFSPAIDAGVTQADGYLNFWLYVSDVGKLGIGQIEVGSGGVTDVNEYNWPPPSGLVDGWNAVSLTLSAGFATADSWNEYPYAIRINGFDDAYVVNVAIENGYQGVVADAGSDRHYIKNVGGATTHGFIRIWASTEGWVEDCHSNLNFWPRNAYGITPWMEEAGDVFWGSFLTTRKANDRLIHIDDASNEHLMNNFIYGGAHGVHTNNATVDVFNIGTDNVGGYTVIDEPGSNGNTSNVSTSYNELHL